MHKANTDQIVKCIGDRQNLLCDLNIFEQKVQIQSLMFQNWAKWLISIYKASDNTNVVNNAISQILRHITRDVHLKNVLF